MGIFKRVGDIISANLNDLVDRFENPEKMLRQALREMEASISEATAAAAKTIASEKLIAKELAENERRAADWRVRAERAVEAGDDDLARRALRRAQEHENVARALQDQLATTAETARTLRRQVEAMKAKHAEARRKLETLTARQRAADARRRFEIGLPDRAIRSAALHKFDALQQRIERAEAEADAMLQLRLDDDGLDVETCEDEAAVEAELAEIKQRAGKSVEG